MLVTIADENGDDSDRIFLTVTRDDPKGVRYNLITLAPTYKGEKLRFTYTASPWLLTIKTAYGNLEMCFDKINEVLQIRSCDGIGVSFFIDFTVHELFVDRLDGSVEAGFTSMGEFLFDVLTGNQHHDNKWIGPRMKATPTTIQWEPENNELKGYVHWSHSFVEKQKINDFEECVAANKKDYEYWFAQLPPLPEEYRDIGKIGAYVFWTSHQLPLIRLKEPIMYMMRTGVVTRGTTWQQCDHAMACWRNQQFAFDIIYSFFTLQDEYGMLPDNANDRDVAYTATKPPFQGFALTWIMDHLGDENIDKSLCAKLYEPLCRWIKWWETFRDGDKDGLMCYAHGDECGLDDASIFSEGVPVISPDLQAYLALCMEVCGRFAKILGMEDEAAQHFRKSKELIQRMIDKLWNGDRFVCILERTKRVLNASSVCNYIPLVLGKRLPKEIIDKMADDLANPGKFYTEKGFRSESFDSPLFDSSSPGPFALGMRMAVSQLLMTVGLYYSGKNELALKNAENWCSLSIGRGFPVTDVVEPENHKKTSTSGKPIFNATTKYPGKFNSWGTAVFFVLGDIISELRGK